MRSGESRTLRKIYIKPYGKYKGWFSAYTLTCGYWQLKNLLELIREHTQTSGLGIGITLNINSGPFGFFSPYAFEVKQGRSTSELNTLWDVFPQANKIHEQNLTEFGEDYAEHYLTDLRIPRIEARYFLGIEENADTDIRRSTNTLLTHWKNKLGSKRLGEQALAKDAIKYILAAFNSLSNGGNDVTAFNRIVAQLADAPDIYDLNKYEL